MNIQILLKKYTLIMISYVICVILLGKRKASPKTVASVPQSNKGIHNNTVYIVASSLFIYN